MISDYLKAKLAEEIPGILTATSCLENGKQIIRISKTGADTPMEMATAYVGPFASDNEVEAGIRLALNIPKPLKPWDEAADGPEHITAPLPAVNITEPKPMANLTGGYKPGSLRALLQGVKDRTDAVMSGAVADIQDLHKTLDHVENVSRDAKQTASDIRAEMGLITNFPDDDETKA